MYVCEREREREREEEEERRRRRNDLDLVCCSQIFIYFRLVVRICINILNKEHNTTESMTSAIFFGLPASTESQRSRELTNIDLTLKIDNSCPSKVLLFLSLRIHEHNGTKFQALCLRELGFLLGPLSIIYTYLAVTHQTLKITTLLTHKTTVNHDHPSHLRSSLKLSEQVVVEKLVEFDLLKHAEKSSFSLGS